MNIHEKYIIEKGMPAGWDKGSVDKLAKTIGKRPNQKGFFDDCYKHMSKHMDPSIAKGL